jgi:hypothetical protein
LQLCLSVNFRYNQEILALTLWSPKFWKVYACISTFKPGFHMVAKIEARSFSSAEIQHFRTENTRSDYNYREYLWFICGLQVETIINWPLRKIVSLFLRPLRPYETRLYKILKADDAIIIFFCQFFLIHTGCIKKGNRTSARYCTWITRRMNNFFHIRKDQAFSYWMTCFSCQWRKNKQVYKSDKKC